jgi:uncharacterized metal-binding protein
MNHNATRLFFISLVLLVMISFPVATTYNLPKTFMGWPVFAIYVFAIWAIFVLAVWLIVRKMPHLQKRESDE